MAWYRRKAERGDADAQYNLAVCFDEGKGVDPDPVLALLVRVCICVYARVFVCTHVHIIPRSATSAYKV